MSPDAIIVTAAAVCLALTVTCAAYLAQYHPQGPALEETETPDPEWIVSQLMTRIARHPARTMGEVSSRGVTVIARWVTLVRHESYGYWRLEVVTRLGRRVTTCRNLEALQAEAASQVRTIADDSQTAEAGKREVWP